MKRISTALTAIAFAIALLVPTSASAEPQPAARLVIEFEGGDPTPTFELLSRTSLLKVLAPSDSLGAEPRSGFWYEVQSANQAVLYRRIVTNPIRLVFEGPDNETADEIPKRDEVLPDRRVFSVVVPRPSPGDDLVIFSSPLEPNSQAEPAEEIARISLAVGR